MTEVRDIRRAFDAAHERFAAATSFEVQRDEMSNMLNQLFRMVEMFKGGVGALPDGTAKRVSLYRHKDTHETTAVASEEDMFNDTFTDMFGVLVWTAPESITSDNRFERYKVSEIVGQPVVETPAQAFDEAEALPDVEALPNDDDGHASGSPSV
jgi:hypothetical protein